MLFSDLGLGEKLLEAIKNAGYVEPTPIQEQAIPFVLQGRDVLGCAQTGTGKTASFVLPMIEKLATGRARARMPRSLILEPTRELAAQVQENFEKYGANHKLNTCLIIGGESMQEQTRKLDRGVDVLIATPGRLIDQFERGNILMTDIRLLVIDECDRMLDMGFIPDIEKIVARLPRTRQTLLFSATVPPEIRRLADTFLSSPQEISVAAPSSTATLVEQAVVMVDPADKREALRHLLAAEDVRNAFIFCNRKRDIALLEKWLKRHGFNAGALHGDMVQSARQSMLEQFKQNEVTLLVCSDVAARGLDVTGVSHVFNFDVPHHPEDYVHRIGRTGRAGASGKAYMIATADDAKATAAIVKLIGKPIPEMSLPELASAEADDGPPARSSRAERSRPEGERAERPRRARGGEGRAAARPTRQDVEPAESAEREAEPAERETDHSGQPAYAEPREDRPRRGRSRSGRDRNERASSERPGNERSGNDRNAGERAGGERQGRDRPADDRQAHERQRNDRQGHDRQSRDRSLHDRPVSERSINDRSVHDDRPGYRDGGRSRGAPVLHGHPGGGERAREDSRFRGEGRPSRGRYDYEDDHDSVVGFGDHLPAFLKVIPRMPGTEEQGSSEE